MIKVFSFFVLFIFTIVIFIQNTTMSFAMHQSDMSTMMKNINIDCSWTSTTSSVKWCNHECCYESTKLYKLVVLNNIREEGKKVNIKIKNLVSIHKPSLELYININKSSSPPELTRKLIYYSYKDLIKIVKSNI